MTKFLSMLAIFGGIAVLSTQAQAACWSAEACAKEELPKLWKEARDKGLSDERRKELCEAGSWIRGKTTLRSFEGEICKQNDRWAAFFLIYCREAKGFKDSHCYTIAKEKFKNLKTEEPMNYKQFRDAGYPDIYPPGSDY